MAYDFTEKFNQSVVLLTSSDRQNTSFGTGFVIRRTGDFAYILTCAHVVKDIGQNSICVEGLPGSLVETGDDLGLDLAVVRVDGLVEAIAALPLETETRPEGDAFVTAGFKVFDPRGQTYRKSTMQGTVNQTFQIRAISPNNSIRAWELRFDEGNAQAGYSGSPVFNARTGKVFGVISHSLRDGVGAAIALSELERIWQPIDVHQLRDALLQLGYMRQSLEFQRSLQRNPIGAYLIHGATDEYGQQWLVNRLLTQYVPTSLNAKKVQIHLNRVGRRSDVRSLWQEIGVELLRDRQTPPKQMVEKALKWWETRDLMLAIYNVNCLSEELLNRLIHDFWLPLANAAEGVRSQVGIRHKLMLFLVDFEAITADREIPDIQKIDLLPKNSEFSQDELMGWMVNQSRYLPRTMVDQTDDTVKKMYELSDEGIPEWTFLEICKRCGYDWYTESGKWYTI